MGRLFYGPPGAKEVSLRHFDPACPPKYQGAVTARRASLPPEFLKWVDETLADQRYIDLHGARNPFTHAWLRRHLFDRRWGAMQIGLSSKCSAPRSK